jgi:transcriptional regulator with PAS, ATPase and Fis domain
MIIINRSVFLHIEHIIVEYPRIDEFIEISQNNPYFGRDDEQRILTLKQHKAAVQDVFNQSSDDTRQVIDALYLNRDPNKTADGVALALHISRATLFYRRNKFFESVRKRLGW